MTRSAPPKGYCRPPAGLLLEEAVSNPLQGVKIAGRWINVIPGSLALGIKNEEGGRTHRGVQAPENLVLVADVEPG